MSEDSSNPNFIQFRITELALWMNLKNILKNEPLNCKNRGGDPSEKRAAKVATGFRRHDSREATHYHIRPAA